MSKNGFSLVELLIATSLSAFVLIGISTIGASLARNQIEGIRSGTQVGWSVVSYMSMAKEIEDGNVLVHPAVNGATSDSIVICKNWSRQMGVGPPAGDRLNTDAGLAPDGVRKDTVYVIQYCVDPTAPVAPETGFKIHRYALVGPAVTCPLTGVPVTCNAAGPGWTENGTIGYRVEKLAGFPLVFQRDNAIGGVRLRYAIGRQTATTNEPTPKFTTFDFGISMAKQYSSTLD